MMTRLDIQWFSGLHDSVCEREKEEEEDGLTLMHAKDAVTSLSRMHAITHTMSSHAVKEKTSESEPRSQTFK
jgi:hypothetical protein